MEDSFSTTAMLRTILLHTKDGLWTVLKRGDSICIVDNYGRCRHQSKGHAATAVSLAGMLAERPLDQIENADGALYLAAERFIKGE